MLYCKFCKKYIDPNQYTSLTEADRCPECGKFTLVEMPDNAGSNDQPEKTAPKKDKIVVRTKEQLHYLIKERMHLYGYDCDLNDIDVSAITDMSYLFDSSRTPLFNGNISEWDVSNVTNMSFMFCNSRFKGDISRWNVCNVKKMDAMFAKSRFNGEISNWDVSHVTNMVLMFSGSQFNGDISRWNVSSVQHMLGMFVGSQFNGDISRWDVRNVKEMLGMFKDSPLENKKPLWYRKPWWCFWEK